MSRLKNLGQSFNNFISVITACDRQEPSKWKIVQNCCVILVLCGVKIVSFLETCTYMCHQSGLMNMNKSLDIVNIILTLLFWSKFRQNRGTSSWSLSRETKEESQTRIERKRAKKETICKWNEEGITIWPLVCNAPSQMRRLEWGHSIEEGQNVEFLHELLIFFFNSFVSHV